MRDALSSTITQKKHRAVMVTVWMQGGIRVYTICVTLHAQLFKSRSGLHGVSDALFEGEASCIYTKNCCVCRCKQRKQNLHVHLLI